ncbi:MAG: ribbon-helix-helix domain-containing protein [Acidimicrobiales bacterium]
MTQIAVKVPEALLGAVDEAVADGMFASRSQAVRAGLETVLRARREDRLVLRYAEALRAVPETDRELAAARRLALSAIDDEPWDPSW